VRRIGVGFFAAWYKFLQVTFEEGSRLAIIGRSAFSSAMLLSICIPASVRVIGKCCFMRCALLSMLEFQSGSNLTRIGKSAFACRRSLDSLCIPTLVERIGAWAFLESGITEISVDENNAYFRVAGGFPLDSSGNCHGVSHGDTLEIPRGATGIVARAFSRCRMPWSVRIPASVESIGSRCFEDCGCLSIVSFAPGSKLTRIEGRTFRHCQCLKTFCIPESVEQVDASGFLGTQISTLTLDEANTNFRTFGDFLVDFGQSVLISYFGRAPELTIDRCSEHIGSSCFWRRFNISKVEFEPGALLTCIGDEAFFRVFFAVINLHSRVG
jgi:hypothetical protein